MQTIYAVIDNDVDGGMSARPRPRAYFTKAADAEAIAQPPYDSVGTIKVYESAQDYELQSSESLRNRALAKLTPEEKRALGL